MRETANQETVGSEVACDRRQGARMPAVLPIEVSGFDLTGHLFLIRTVTSEISERGCRMRLDRRLPPGEVVAVRLLANDMESSPENKPALFQIIWTARDERGWFAGGQMLQAADFWHSNLPSSLPQS